MSSSAAIITANTYLHDAAVTLLAACGLVLFITVSRTARGPGPETILNLISLRRRLSPIIIGSLVVITAGAVPRILFFGSFEYARAAERLAVPGLIARHLLALVVLIAGISFWNRGSRLIKQLSSAGAGRKD
jgi:hypothetical protein